MATQQRRISRARRIAREVFGFDDLRAGQDAAINASIKGRDTLAIMPTGSGKSAIYQIAGVLLPGTTVVVSPLIALQHDQLAALEQQEIASAALLNSTLRAAERRRVLEDLGAEALEFLLLAPEQLQNEELLDQLRATPPSLFVVDEAHCISEWGHDFRPDYLRLGAVIEALGHPTVLALTATASPPVRDEIIERLGMRNPAVIVSGFDRPNITLMAERFETELHKQSALLERLTQTPGPGIVYVATRRRAEDLAQAISERGLRASPYHGGMRADVRHATQAAFMSDELDVIVATSAFGMGIDKPNVRFVFHADISDSLDAYYQEIGRAGRDSDPAEARLFYRPEDLGLRRFFASGQTVVPEHLELIAAALRSSDGPLPLIDLRDVTGLSHSRLTTTLHKLQEVGLVAVRDEEAAELLSDDLDAAIDELQRIDDRHRALSKSRVEMMRGYAELRCCRREYLLSYFGESFAPPCANCDNCRAGKGLQEHDGDRPFALNGRVEHREWGEGMVVRYEGQTVVVLFDEVGYRSLDVPLILELGLLQMAA